MAVKLTRYKKLQEVLYSLWGRDYWDYGNRCGHDAQAPRPFVPPMHHDKRPLLIIDTIERLTRFLKAPTNIKGLAERIVCLSTGEIKKRDMRSERREAVVLVMSCHLHHMDMVTMRVGKPGHDGIFRGLSNYEIAELCQISLRRVERAMAELVAVGWIKVHKKAEKLRDGVYNGLAAIRTISKHVFFHFGISKTKLKNQRNKAYKRACVKAENPPKDSKEEAHLKMTRAQHMAACRKVVGLKEKKAAGLEHPCHRRNGKDPP